MSNASGKEKCEFEIALEDFKKNAQLGPDEIKEFRFADLNSLRSTIKRIQAEQEAKRRMRNMKRLEPFLQTMEQYGHIVDVFVNTSEVLAFVWGPMKFLLRLLRVALSCSKRTYIVVDGLDECDTKERKYVVEFFRNTVEALPVADMDSIRCLFVSQDDREARKDLSNIPSINICPSDTKHDIHSFVMIWKDKIESKFGDLQGTRYDIAKIVTAKAQGMFLFAKLVMENFKTGMQCLRPVLMEERQESQGSSSRADSEAFFDPDQYRVVLLDQRGCGKSRPNAETRENTTLHLVEDIEKLRRHLKIEKWHVVFGGSWGSTLALAYAQTHPGSVGSLILRGIFAVRKLELNWTLIEGANIMWPDAFEEFINFLPEEERKNHVESYRKRLLSDDPKISLPAARAWNKWELSIGTLYPSAEALKQLDDESYLLAHARTEVHYFTNGAWLEEGQLLKKENVDKIRHIPSESAPTLY
ncbi:hypothetical protein SLS64_001608 [Diaporthe eres]